MHGTKRLSLWLSLLLYHLSISLCLHNSIHSSQTRLPRQLETPKETLITWFQCCKGFAFWAPRTPQRECPAILRRCVCLLQVCKQRPLHTADFKCLICSMHQDLLSFLCYGSCWSHLKLGMGHQSSPHKVLFIVIRSLCTCLERLTFKIHDPNTPLVSLKLALPGHVLYHSPARLALIFKDQKPRAAAAIACNCQHLAPKLVDSICLKASFQRKHNTQLNE